MAIHTLMNVTALLFDYDCPDKDIAYYQRILYVHDTDTSSYN